MFGGLLPKMTKLIKRADPGDSLTFQVSQEASEPAVPQGVWVVRAVSMWWCLGIVPCGGLCLICNDEEVLRSVKNTENLR